MKEDANKWMVMVNCMTYNHAPYITDAMNGFCMQETDFPYVCIIVDDASIDGEQDVIKSYLQTHFDLDDNVIVCKEDTDDYQLLFARHKTNCNCYFAVFFLKYNHYGKKDKKVYYKKWVDTSKYVASCEGDDYWIDRFKLQRQVYFLETHTDYVMHFHNAIVRFQNRNHPDHIISQFQSGDFDTALLYEKWQLPTASLLYRREIFDNPLYVNRPQGYPGDMTLFYTASQIGKVFGLSECLSVYRKNDGGVSNSISTGLWLKYQYGFAKEINNKQAINHCRKVLSRAICIFLPKYIRGDKEAQEIYQVAIEMDKNLLLKTLPRMLVLWPWWIIKRLVKHTFSIINNFRKCMF